MASAISLGTWICTHQEWREGQPPPTVAQYITQSQEEWTVQVEGVDEGIDLMPILQKRLYGRPLQDYIQHKLLWTRDQIESTNWAALHKALAPYPLHARTTRMKAMYGWLHTHQWKERIYSTSPTCPFCYEEDSNDHVWVCQGTTSNREEALSRFLSSIKKTTPSAAWKLMRQRLSQTMALIETTSQDDATQTEIDDTDLSNMILAAGEDQDELGWLNFIKGRQSVKWEDAYNTYLDTIAGRKPHRSGLAWGSKLVTASLQLLVDIWCSRNDQYHNKDEDGNHPETQQIHQRVRETYEDRLAYTQEIQELLFDKTLEQRLQQRPFQLVKWIQTVDITSKIVIDQRQAPIHAYFQPTRPPDEYPPDEPV
jgi:hypothetical protein